MHARYRLAAGNSHPPREVVGVRVPDPVRANTLTAASDRPVAHVVIRRVVIDAVLTFARQPLLRGRRVAIVRLVVVLALVISSHGSIKGTCRVGCQVLPGKCLDHLVLFHIGKQSSGCHDVCPTASVDETSLIVGIELRI
jgi:hypothetical protein